uniref:Uncharacterized protein n=1 Tax=Globodera rostochiensis TaxID=31243 RepID=A0A914GP93_GLORO
MSDNANDEEQQQQIEKIFICTDIWHGVFAFLNTFELGLKMALISDRLDVLVDVHFKSREWSLGWLRIRRATDGNGAQIVNRSGDRLPIPEGPLPCNVIGFEWIEISYIDQTVVEFLQRFRRLFDSSGTKVWINTGYGQRRSWGIIWQKIWPLVTDNIRCFLSYSPPQFNRLRQFSPAVLRNCPNLRSIHSAGLFPEFPAEDNANASSHQAVAKWLLTPRGDGRPKMLNCDDLYLEEMEGLKRSFVNASEPVNFIIRLRFAGIESFELKNNLTGEQLSLRRFNKDIWLLVRCPIGREEDKWTNWEKEVAQWSWYGQRNCIVIAFRDSDIGDGVVEAEAGPSEPKKPKK